jgi:hypothetical protein
MEESHNITDVTPAQENDQFCAALLERDHSGSFTSLDMPRQSKTKVRHGDTHSDYVILIFDFINLIY